MTTRSCAALLIVALSVPSCLAAEEMVLAVDPQASQVTFDLPATGHDVHGSFPVTGGEVRFDPASGAASGEIRVDATGGETGNGKRDKTMHRKVLESATYPAFVFRLEHFSGELPSAGEGHVTLHGTFVVHGSEHPVDLDGAVTVEGDRLSGSATFPIPFEAWGLHNPSMFFLKVANEVSVSVQLAGTLTSANGAAVAAAGP